MKTITSRQLATIKRVAQNVNPLLVKKEKMQAKISLLAAEINDLDQEINGHEAGVLALTEGYPSTALIQKTFVLSDKVDDMGNPVKTTKYVPTDILVQDEKGNYIIVEEEMPKVVVDEIEVEDCPVIGQHPSEGDFPY